MCVALDAFTVQGCSRLYGICCSTTFEADEVVPDIIAVTLWETIVNIWMTKYVEPPDIAVLDQATTLLFNYFENKLTKYDIRIESNGVETHWGSGHGERFHVLIGQDGRKPSIKQSRWTGHRKRSYHPILLCQ